jgi:glycosyltransferase involved in cell wall biosynthesis
VIDASLKRLRETVTELIRNGELWRALSAAGPKAVAERHSPEKCVGKYEELYAAVSTRPAAA